MQDEARYGVRIFPVDSEHSAIFQSLEDVKRMSAV
jgi:1-deoxy-D-xylulose 5-phosphate reductoisomerase